MGQHWSVVGVRSHMVIVLSIVVVCGWRREWISWLWLGHSFNFDNCACPSLLSLSMDFPSCPPISAHVLAYIPTQPHSLQANLIPYNVVFFCSRCQWILCLWLGYSFNHKCRLLLPLPTQLGLILEVVEPLKVEAKCTQNHLKWLISIQ